jgi:hypothetical protein
MPAPHAFYSKMLALFYFILFYLCALKLGDRSSPLGVARGLFSGFKRSRGVAAAAPPIKLKWGARTIFHEKA